MECLFCNIATGNVSSDVVYEDDVIKVFKDIHPAAPVHYLVIPKIHIPSVADLQENESQSKIVAKMIYTAKQVAEGAGLKGYKLVFNVGKEGGQVIAHLHLHMLGGWGEGVEKRVGV